MDRPDSRKKPLSNIVLLDICPVDVVKHSLISMMWRSTPTLSSPKRQYPTTFRHFVGKHQLFELVFDGWLYILRYRDRFVSRFLQMFNISISQRPSSHKKQLMRFPKDSISKHRPSPGFYWQSNHCYTSCHDQNTTDIHGNICAHGAGVCGDDGCTHT